MAMAELINFSSATLSISFFKSRTMIWVLLLLLLCSTKATSLNQEGLYLLEAKTLLSDPAQSLATWNPRDLNPCSWRGVTCNTETHQINSLDLSNFQLAGPFPLVLCRLPYLSSLSLFNNLINSSLPAEISRCQALKYLNLSQNFLDGSIPGSLSEIHNLQQLDLSYNSFSGKFLQNRLIFEFRCGSRLRFDLECRDGAGHRRVSSVGDAVPHQQPSRRINTFVPLQHHDAEEVPASVQPVLPERVTETSQ